MIGASRHAGSVGAEIFRNLIAAGFNGPVYPVNPEARVVQSVPAYASVTEIPGDVDLAVIVVPAKGVLDAARQCAAKQVGALIVISAGFAETGADGARRQAELLSICRESGMRLIGPNCLGTLNTSADVKLNATFSPSFPSAGRVGFMSQSGALGLALIDRAQARGIGLSSFASVGNKADVSGNDLLQYWETDQATSLIVLYLESFGTRGGLRGSLAASVAGSRSSRSRADAREPAPPPPRRTQGRSWQPRTSTSTRSFARVA